MHTLSLFKALVAALSIATVTAQQATTDPSLPNLDQVTGSTTSTTAASTTSATSATRTTGSTTGSATSQTSGTTSGTTSLVPVTLSSISGQSTSTSSQSLFIVSLSALPTIAGAGIPTMIVPYTANAPFMQHSDLPEGTVFIAVGAVLAFLGACVLLWRGLVAWSINRSVKRAALASIRGGSEKTTTNWGGSSTGYNPARGSMYKDVGDSMSMEALTSSGKPIRSHFKDDASRGTPPPQNLFFSPTAQARSEAPRPMSDVYNNRSSSYLPAGYYAAPNSHVAGGARNTIVGGNGIMPPYARHSAVYEPSPPASPALRPSTATVHTRTSHDQLRAPSRDGTRLSSTLYSQPSNSSLAVGLNSRPSRDGGLAGSRAPSAYLEGLFENHTAMASRDHL